MGGTGDMGGLTAVVTGGSRGLGLLIARELGREGCSVSVWGRDPRSLEAAARQLRAEGVEVLPVACDVRDEDEVREAVVRVEGEFGGIDVMIANAGVIQVAPLEAQRTEDFRDAMDTMFYGALYPVLHALPLLRRSPAGGRIAVISSIGGRVPVPHLLPYTCAKFAAGALSEGLRAELGPQGVSVTSVFPGLMRTGSHLHARFGGPSRREYGWFSALASMPLLSMDAERAAARIVRAVRRRRTLLMLTPWTRAASLAHGVAPATVSRVSALAARVMPRGTDPHKEEGAEAAAASPSRLRDRLTVLGDRAADRYNQRRLRTR
ncbi:SDR family NAD(P)-dependent oxidoreductase [Streptomyces sp. NPDC059506]|uniref:SDR family NAD(P)-dependent oxidoreductase n=1 Tax=unclassified Streptomyces TaxID=2593676 RepID=UPI0022AAC332|nr:SDR family oxidoreductase [Streptomyces sp. HB2AG]MCZ2525192.1 SDR family oxidoreductase [Streptomyces sp. HB2AG]